MRAIARERMMASIHLGVRFVARSSSRQLLPIVLAYLPVPVIGAALSVVWNVGATPGMPILGVVGDVQPQSAHPREVAPIARTARNE